MYYTIYKITNVLNGKFYIGKHQTKDLDDGYMGSGKLIKRAIEKYGLENFRKEILYIFETEAEMNEAEARHVTLTEESYNLCPGGHGGFGYINKNGLNWTLEKNIRINGFKYLTPEQRQVYSRLGNVKTQAIISSWTREERQMKLASKSFLGKQHSEETKERIRVKARANSAGKNNSQYGKPRSNSTKEKISQTMKTKGQKPPSQVGRLWWNNGHINCRSEVCPGDGWHRGKA